jgi:UDP-N-acetylmuramoylalanine--D-glutamate ligase
MKIVVLGGGESGVGAALLAKAKGFEVFLSDKAKLHDSYREVLLAAGILFEEEIHTEAQILDADEVVKSPGIPDKVEIVQKLKAKKIPVISEIEFAARYTNAKLIAITGSNGKTTTTLLTYHLLKEAGLNVGLAGNVGHSFAELVVEDMFDYYVLEVSSFQLDNCYQFKPYISILTNITPDHLDRYEYKFENYVASKFRIIQSQTVEDYFIYNAVDPGVMNKITDAYGSAAELTPQTVPVAVAESVNEGLRQQPAAGYADDSQIVSVWEQKPVTFTPEEILLKGKHNLFNALCAIQACRILGLSEESIKAGLQTFTNAPHRLENVGVINGITFINDSKATNVDSVFYALGSFAKESLIWIAGGVDKGNDYTQIETLVKQKVKALVCLGKDNEKLVSFFTGKVPAIYQSQRVQEVIQLGLQLGQPGDVVLLSPACASFDLFRNYEDRGNQFRQAVAELTQK